MKVNVISPDKMFYQGNAEAIVCTTEDGDIGILPGHAPYIGKVGTGKVRIHAGGEIRLFAVNSGFIEVKGDEVSILIARARESGDIDLDETRRRISQTTTADLRNPAAFAELQWLRALKYVAEEAEKTA